MDRPSVLFVTEDGRLKFRRHPDRTITRLRRVIDWKDVGQVKRLLSQIPIDIPATGNHPLLYAAMIGDLETVEYLYSLCPLHISLAIDIAASNNHNNVVDFLTYKAAEEGIILG